MDELDKEKGELLLANKHIGDGEERILRQRELVTGLTRRGQASEEAEKLLRAFEQTLTEWRNHRDAIKRRIAVLENEARH